MRVVVLGGGVIGVTTAYYLARSGHEVVLLERHSDVAKETSFANAGQVSAGYASPWAGPGVPLKAVGWLLDRYGPLVIRPVLDPAMYSWMWRMLRNCTSARYDINKSRMLRLSEYSRDCLRALRSETGISYDQGTRGTLQLFRSARQVESAEADLSILRRYGVPARLLDVNGCVEAEPALDMVKEKVAGGVLFPGDETGDCRMFTVQLASLAIAAGVRLELGAEVRGFEHDRGRITGVHTQAKIVQGDAYVLALGSYSPLLLKRLGISVPVYPVKGYSLTVQIADPTAAPVSTIMDESYKVAITRLGTRVRIGGTAELSGYNLQLHPCRRRTLDHSFSGLFPRAGNLAEGVFWCGLRPMTPDGTPIIGPTRYSNLVLNTGHGTLGWTMACGSARLVADLISGGKPDLDLGEFASARYF